MQVTKGFITITSLGDDLFCATLGEDIDNPETEDVIECLHVHYIDDMIAALKAYKEKLS